MQGALDKGNLLLFHSSLHSGLKVDLTLHYISQIDVHVDTTSRTQPSANCYLPLQHLVAFHLLVNDIYLLYGQDGQCGKHRKQIAISMFHMDIDSSGETRLYS